LRLLGRAELSTYKQRLREIGLDWPKVARPDLPFAPVIRVGDVVYVSGQIPEAGDDIFAVGQVGREVDVPTAQKAAQLCAANIVYWLDQELRGDLDRVVRIAKVGVYINAAPGFSQYSQVGNGASVLFLKIFAERGEHARIAIGMAGLPLNVPVEVDAIVHVR
jgi:enamine deaminase RidA (YjgF/YER057c/UK114 family)